MSIDKQAKQHMIDVRNEVIRQGRWPTCTNCEYWLHVTSVEIHEGQSTREEWHECSKYKMIPPEEVVVVGCVNHEPKVPF